MITEEFAKYHNVKTVKSRCINGGTTLTVEFKDGRIFRNKSVDTNPYNISNLARDIIINNSIIEQRKRKMNSICGRITEEKQK